MTKKHISHNVPQYRTISTDNHRHVISGISKQQMNHDIDRYGELAAQDATQPGKWLRVFKRDGRIIAEDE